MKPKLQIIQLIRGYAAISVFLCHFLEEYTIKIHLTGQLGVAVFFWISGFLMIYTTYGKTNNYLVNRLLRILPLYYLTTLGVFVIGHIAPGLLHTADPTVENLLKSLLFIPCRIEGTNLIQPLLAVGWTLYLEMFTSIIFYIALKIFKSNVKAGYTVVVVLLMFVFINEVTKTNVVWLNIYGGRVSLYWAAGILFSIFYSKKASLKQRYSKDISNIWKSVLVVLGCGVFLICENYYRLTIIEILLISVLMSVAILLFSNIRFPKTYLFLGKISYSFYLLHYFVIKAFSRLIAPKMKSGGVILNLILSFAITVFMSLISYELIENRATSCLRKTICNISMEIKNDKFKN